VKHVHGDSQMNRTSPLALTKESHTKVVKGQEGVCNDMGGHVDQVDLGTWCMIAKQSWICKERPPSGSISKGLERRQYLTPSIVSLRCVFNVLVQPSLYLVELQ